MIRPDDIVEAMDRRSLNGYVLVAKWGLWVTSIVLAVIILGLSYRCVTTYGYNTAVLSIMVQACQVAAFICITVLGFHGYAGQRIFHLLRHWDDPKP